MYFKNSQFTYELDDKFRFVIKYLLVVYIKLQRLSSKFTCNKNDAPFLQRIPYYNKKIIFKKEYESMLKCGTSISSLNVYDYFKVISC
jgi:hypothetical protein